MEKFDNNGLIYRVIHSGLDVNGKRDSGSFWKFGCHYEWWCSIDPKYSEACDVSASSKSSILLYFDISNRIPFIL